MSEKKMELRIITPTRMFYDGEVNGFTVRTSGEIGDFTILPDHIPITSAIGVGSVEIMEDEGMKIATLMEGYVVFSDNKAAVIAHAAEWPYEIDIERAEDAKLRAENRLNQGDVDKARAEAALRRSLVRLNISKLK